MKIRKSVLLNSGPSTRLYILEIQVAASLAEEISFKGIYLMIGIIPGS